MDEHNELRTRLRAVGMELFRRDGLRFTMQQAAAMMHISKKTIYAVYPSKEALLLDMVDDAFTRIHARKQRLLDGPGTLAEKLRAVIIALPEEYTALDLQQMDLLDEKYPRVAARVREHLETGWEPTLALLEQAMGEGVIRRVSLPVLQRMISGSIEDYLALFVLLCTELSFLLVRLTGAVFAHKPHNCTAFYIQIDMIKYSVAAKRLAHTAN